MHHPIIVLALSLLTGLVIGFIFSLFKLPIPAPQSLSGIVGILGIYLGFKFFFFIEKLLHF